jgi:uncharacterized protein YggT (Ycf19 family)
MSYFVKSPVGLIIAFLNVSTFLLLIYVLLQTLEEGRRGKVFRILDNIFSPFLSPLRRFLPIGRIDSAAIVLIVILQLIAFIIKRG